MDEKERVVQKPVLYIHQPKEEEITANMQSYFYYKKNEDRGKKEESSRPQQLVIEKEHEQEEEQERQSNYNNKHSARERRQAFNEMSILEKIQYFVYMPKKVPKMKCEVITEEKKYRGYIQSLENEVVQMKIFQRPFQAEIPLNEIQDVKLIGF